MTETTVNSVTISLEEYMDLRHRAEMNGFLMNELGRMEARFQEIDRQFRDIWREMKKNVV